MTPAQSVPSFSRSVQYSWRGASAAVASTALGCPGSLGAGVLFGITHYFFVSLFRDWSDKPQAQQRPRELVQWISQIAVKLLASHACTWAVMRCLGFKWTVAHVAAMSLAHIALGLLVIGVISSILHLTHVGLLKAVGS